MYHNSYASIFILTQLQNHDGGQDDVIMAHESLLPLARSMAANWREGNRREAAYLLAHVTGTGPETSKMVTATSRILKKVSLVLIQFFFVQDSFSLLSVSVSSYRSIRFVC
jgi:hypothetical protein